MCCVQSVVPSPKTLILRPKSNKTCLPFARSSSASASPSSASSSALTLLGLVPFSSNFCVHNYSTMFEWVDRFIGEFCTLVGCFVCSFVQWHTQRRIAHRPPPLFFCVCVCDLDRLDQEPLLEGGDGAHTCWAAELWQIHIRRRHCGSYVTLVASQTKAPVQNLGERTSAGKCCLMCCTSWGLFALFCLSCSHALRCAFFCSLENTTRT